MISRTNILTHERVGRLLAGAAVLVSLLLAHLVSPWFLLAAAATGLNLMLSAVTDSCVVKNLLIRLGFPGERDVGRAEAIVEQDIHPTETPRRRAVPRPARWTASTN